MSVDKGVNFEDKSPNLKENQKIENLNSLRAKFSVWLYKSLDYGYYSPVKSKTDKEKYPLIVFFHGMWHWKLPMSQVYDS